MSADGTGDPPPTVHGTAVALDGRAVLILGSSGSGKSDLALRLIEAGWTLVADDRVVLSRRSETLVAAPPRSLAGLIEARGIGLCRVPFLAEAEVALAVELIPAGRIERHPEPASRVFLGIHIPLINIVSFEASAPAKLRLALEGGVAR
ncbi:MAG: serine/threonine protein kinase [Alphaproteobacteria bacterium]|nr:serine/threonine protein kinase [Alphaproteobacteria bacterium]